MRFILLALALLIADKSIADTSIQELARAGKMEQAYELLLERPERNAVDDYNLGTLALRTGHLGASVAYLEKANYLKRHDPDFMHNLEIARASLVRTLGSESKLDPASTWTEKLADHVSLEELRGVLGLLALAVSLLWIRVYLRVRGVRGTRDFKKCLLDPGSLTGLLTLGLVLGLYFLEREAGARPPVVLLSHVSVRSGPGNEFVQVAEIDAGVKLRMLGSAKASLAGEPVLAGAPSFVLGQAAPAGEPSPAAPATPAASAAEAPLHANEAWLQVRYSSEEIGWIPASAALVID
jgi:hypothetical protein